MGGSDSSSLSSLLQGEELSHEQIEEALASGQGFSFVVTSQRVAIGAIIARPCRNNVRPVDCQDTSRQALNEILDVVTTSLSPQVARICIADRTIPYVSSSHRIPCEMFLALKAHI